jgi:hypothetical protein
MVGGRPRGDLVHRELFRHPNWLLAERLLQAVRPGSTTFLPDGIAGLSSRSWSPFPFEDWSPPHVRDALLGRCRPLMPGNLVVVTDASFGAATGPFFVHSDDLPGLIDEHPDRCGSPFLDIDLVIVSPLQGAVLVVHHNGLIATVPGQVVKHPL